MAEFFGIYGNTVVIDHGYGLLSLYGHLSSFAVKAGDAVKRGQTVGHSGASGLAGGDHLHYSMVLQSVQVDPKEWWDPALDQGPHHVEAGAVRRRAGGGNDPLTVKTARRSPPLASSACRCRRPRARNASRS